MGITHDPSGAEMSQAGTLPRLRWAAASDERMRLPTGVSHRPSFEAKRPTTKLSGWYGPSAQTGWEAPSSATATVKAAVINKKNSKKFFPEVKAASFFCSLFSDPTKRPNSDPCLGPLNYCFACHLHVKVLIGLKKPINIKNPC